ncbi:MAG: hypothetical protein J6Y01_04270 [Spirochaetales bacterium]|nr:hypothetical protein [Spirochaetales bacterium]
MDYQNIQWQSGNISCEPSAELSSVLDEMTDINPSFQDCGIIICNETDLSAAVSVKK